MNIDTVLDAIRAALANDASDEVRTAGIHACRAILATLDPQPVTAPPAAPSPVAMIAAALRNVPPDQLLDLAIAKLRAALPADADVKPTAAMRIPIVPVPGARR